MPAVMGGERQRERGTKVLLQYNTTLSMLHLGEVSGLADSVDPTECDNVGSALVLGLHHVPQDVDSALGAQDLHQTLLHAGPHQALDAWGGGRGGRVMVTLGLPLHAPPTTRRHSPVNVPTTFPSSLAATESHSFTAISTATFFVMRCSFMCSSAGSMASREMVLPTVSVLKNENIPPLGGAGWAGQGEGTLSEGTQRTCT